jgi:hypothetical protein
MSIGADARASLVVADSTSERDRLLTLCSGSGWILTKIICPDCDGLGWIAAPAT